MPPASRKVRLKPSIAQARLSSLVRASHYFADTVADEELIAVIVSPRKDEQPVLPPAPDAVAATAAAAEHFLLDTLTYAVPPITDTLVVFVSLCFAAAHGTKDELWGAIMALALVLGTKRIFRNMCEPLFYRIAIPPVKFAFMLRRCSNSALQILILTKHLLTLGLCRHTPCLQAIFQSSTVTLLSSAQRLAWLSMPSRLRQSCWFHPQTCPATTALSSSGCCRLAAAASWKPCSGERLEASAAYTIVLPLTPDNL